MEPHHLELLARVVSGGRESVAEPGIAGEADQEELEMADLFDDVQEAIDTATCDFPDPPQDSIGVDRVNIALSQKLQSLHILRCSGPSSDAWSPLWQQLPTSLTELDLSENNLNDHAIAALCGALRNVQLTRLTLCGNRCKDLQRLADLISRGGVEVLNLAENSLNDSLESF